MTATTFAELCGDCRRPQRIVGWHRDDHRDAVLGFCHDCSEARYVSTGQRIATIAGPRPYRWL